MGCYMSEPLFPPTVLWGVLENNHPPKGGSRSSDLGEILVLVDSGSGVI